MTRLFTFLFTLIRHTMMAFTELPADEQQKILKWYPELQALNP